MLGNVGALLLDSAPAVPSNWLDWVATWGPGGVLVVLILTGVLEPKRVRTSLEAERNAWKAAFEKEQDAHVVTREALAAAEARGVAAIESAKTLTQLLEAIGHESVRRDGGAR
jgi:hypothetical protein